MKTINSLVKQSSVGAVLIGALLSAPVAAAEGLDNVYGDIRFRVETVEQDNGNKDALAATLRSRLGYLSDAYYGFSAGLEAENNTVLVDHYNDTVGGGSQYSVVPDPSFTEIDQAYLRYEHAALSVKVGRQVLAYGNQRFIGHVGWRQDRQVFDAISVDYSLSDDVSMRAAYLDKRRRIFANEKDIDSSDLLFNLSYKTAARQLSAYAYLLEADDVARAQSDSFGLSYSGSANVNASKLHYRLEFASQRNETLTTQSDSHYGLLELAATFGAVTSTLGYELLAAGSGQQAFTTPLATGHKFNGWADQYLTTPAEGLVDIYVSLSGKVAGGKWVLTYHDFSADEDTATVDDLGSEINALYARKFSHGLSGGIKYAAFNAGDIKVDTDKLWLWMSVAF